MHLMIDKEEWSTIKLLIMYKTTILFVSVCLHMRLKSGSQSGLHRQRKNLIFLHHGSQEAKQMKCLLDLLKNQISTGQIMPQELN